MAHPARPDPGCLDPGRPESGRPESGRLDRARRFYAALVAGAGGARDPRIEAAFAAVPREDFAGPGPWSIMAGGGYVTTPDDDPAWLQADVLVALDAARGINNGEPSLHARCLDALDLQPGESVLHVGAGGGYYTAILAWLVGGTGRVDAYEIDPTLAARAARNLAGLAQVRVHAADGTAGALPEADAVYVNASATHPAPSWLDALRPGGRLLFPLTPTEMPGGMLLVTRRPHGFDAGFISRAGFIPCQGMQDGDDSAGLARAFAAGKFQQVRSLRVGTAPDRTSWFAGKGWWLSTAPLAGTDGQGAA